MINICDALLTQRQIYLQTKPAKCNIFNEQISMLISLMFTILKGLVTIWQPVSA